MLDKDLAVVVLVALMVTQEREAKEVMAALAEMVAAMDQVVVMVILVKLVIMEVATEQAADTTAVVKQAKQEPQAVAVVEQELNPLPVDQETLILLNNRLNRNLILHILL